MKKVSVTINTQLEKRGKTVYWLSKTTGISANNLGKLVKNETESIRFENIEKICNALECELSDILTLHSEEQ